MNHIEELCVRYEKYRLLGLSVDANETLQTIKEGLTHLPEHDYKRLQSKYVHVFSHVQPIETAHGCYDSELI